MWCVMISACSCPVLCDVRCSGLVHIYICVLIGAVTHSCALIVQWFMAGVGRCSDPLMCC